MPDTKKLLGLDYGEKHIGVALATTIVAEPLVVIPTKDVLTALTALIAKYHITAIVLGMSENIMADKIKLFARQLEDKFHLPVHFMDETLSSKDTRTKLAQLGVKRSVREAKIDHYVAAAILQDYLDSQTY